MGYFNPLLELPAAQEILALPRETLAPLEKLLRQMRDQANDQAEIAWKRRKGFQAAYWRVVSTYARHCAHVMSRSTASRAPKA